MIQLDINYFAVVVGAVIHMIIGAAWFSPALFGKQWMKFSGITEEKMQALKKKGMTKAYAWSFIGALVMTWALAALIGAVGAATIREGIKIGLLAWLGFVATTSLAGVLWAGKSKELYLLENGHHIVTFVVLSAFLTVWK